MASIFERLWKAGPAGFIAKAILVALVADALLLAFILGRRAYRKRYFAKRDSRVFEFRQKWESLIAGEIPYETWRRKPFDRRIIESMALDMFEVAGPEESARLLKFLRASGLIEKRIFEARKLTGWRRMRALVALGRTRAPEGIPALAEGLRDGAIETRLASLRGLGRTASPQAGQEILAWVGENGLVVPALPLQSALIQCCAERPQILLPYLQHAAGPVREVLGRVLGEIATPSLSMELLQFVGDDLDELRAAAARALSNGQPGVAFDVLEDLSQDRAWFVRLRAIVSLGKLSGPRAIPPLLRGLTDSHRLVRLRAAEALVGLTTNPIAIFDQVVSTGDRYGLHAYLTALENADLRKSLEQELSVSVAINE
ncbi:MAG TPA: HEAT repeat domain-containing protein, partial [Chthoniobacterales bacterium]|nr:HEAT repeat domain-containing protein [Chthoniobacterales bacterium]